MQMEAGELLGIMGPNGAGKTTLLKLVWGFLRPDKGSISVFRQQPHLNQVSVRLRAGYLPESPSFYGWMTARRHLDFVSEFYDGWDRTKANALLDRFEIDPNLCIRLMPRSARTKLALIAAVSHNPLLLVLDEPTAGLDLVTRHDVLEFLNELAKNHGVGIVVSSHIADDLDTLADSVLMLNAGHVLEYAPTQSLTHHYGRDRMEEIFREAIHRMDVHP